MLGYPVAKIKGPAISFSLGRRENKFANALKFIKVVALQRSI